MSEFFLPEDRYDVSELLSYINKVQANMSYGMMIPISDIVKTPEGAMLLFLNPEGYWVEKTEHGYDLWQDGGILYRQYIKGSNEIFCFFEEWKYPLDDKIMELLEQ